MGCDGSRDNARSEKRDDFYKKHVSADPIAVRLPYAVVTKLVELKGWKRYEMNKLMTFAGTDGKSFDSIYRRSCVVMMNGQFVNNVVIRKLGGPKRQHSRESSGQTLPSSHS